MILRTIAAALIISLWASPAYGQVTVATGVTEDALSANSQPKLARDPQGTIYLAFVKRAGGFSQIFVARSADGATWTQQQITRGTGDSRFPTLAVGSDGRVHLAWTQYTEPIGKVYYSQFDGRRWSAPVKLSPGEAYAGVPAVAVDLQQQPHVVWYGIRDRAPEIRTRHGSIYEILYSGFAPGRWSEPVVISPGIPDSINPALATAGTGVLHSAWYQFDMRVYQVRHTQRAQSWQRSVQISTGGEDAAAVAVAGAADGSVYVGWERKEPSVSRIYLAERHERWSGQQPLSPTGQAALNPTVTVDSGGRVYVAWDSDGAIYLRRKPAQWLGVERLTRTGRDSHPILSTRGPVVDLVWMEDRGPDRVLRFASLAGDVRRPAPSPGGRIPWVLIFLAVTALILIWQYLRYTSVNRT